jgi:uncharacterized protein YneF (UPF0154 family)
MWILVAIAVFVALAVGIFIGYVWMAYRVMDGWNRR